MKRLHRVFFTLLTLVLALIPAAVSAADTESEGDFLFRVGGTTNVAAGEQLGSVVIVSGDAVVDGTVEDTLIVIDGAATVTGRVHGDVSVIRGSLTLRQGATVENITLIRSDLTRDDGVTVSGTITEQTDLSFGWGAALFSTLFWIGTTLLVLAVALAFVAIGRRQLLSAGSYLTERPLESAGSALALWIGLPIVAIAAFFTLIGIPFTLTIFFVVLPVLGLLGYIVTGTRLGTELLRVTGIAGTTERPYLAAAVGVVVFQVLGLIPWIGGLAVVLAGFIGSGALIYRAIRGRSGGRAVTSGALPVPASA